MSNQDITTIIAGLQILDPKLYQALMALQNRLYNAEQELFPLVRQSQLTIAIAAAVIAPASFTFIFTPTTIRFSWTVITGATIYEIRKGTVWETASFQLRTPSLQADIDPLLTGTHTFLIKSLNSSGVYSISSTQCVVTVPTISAVSINKQVIDNNVLLSWSAPASVFNIKHYEVYRDSSLIGTLLGTFFVRFEAVAGTYIFKIIAVDIAGNRSADATASVTVTAPPDYVLQAQTLSTLNGTRVNTPLLSGPKLLACWATELWNAHFTTRSWGDPKDQVDAGYPIYIQPSSLTGSYEEIIDYGTVLSNVAATIIYNTNLIAGTLVGVVVKMATSTDGSSYSAFVSGASQFLASLRYLKFRFEFTNVDDVSLTEVFNIQISLNVKREIDSGEVSALSTDATGTQVNFNKIFKDIDSITCTVDSTTEPYIVIYDFVDIPNPTGFKVYVFDTTGNRISKLVSWKARGVV